MINFLKNNSKTTVIHIITVVFFIGINSNSSAQIVKDSLFLSDTNNKLINLHGADYLSDKEGDVTIMKLVGNVRFSQDSVFMRSDLGYIQKDFSFIKAVGNVIINQGDSLFLYGDSLDYDGTTKIAIVRGNVRLVENELTLTAPSMKYDLNTNIAYYTQGGTVVSKKNSNTLTSKRGYYYSDFKTLSFKDSVKLTNPEYVMTSDTLDYNETSEIAYFSGNTIIEGEGNLIFCKNGYYDTRNDISEFNQDAYLISDGHTIKGDKLYYDRNSGIGKAVGNIELTDTVNKIVVTGDYGTRNEKSNVSFVTGNTLVNKWFEEGDTMFLTADTIRVVKNEETNKNNLYCFHKVKIYKNDLQGICDSMVYLQSDSMIQLFNNPYIWSENSQMNGDTIFIQLSNNKIKELNLRKNSFIIDPVTLIDTSLNDTIPTGYYNQIKGKNIKGMFSKDTLRKVRVNGNGQSIYFTGDEGKPSQGLNRIDCSDIEIRFDKSKIKEIAFLNQPDGTLFPIQDVSKSDEKLKGFNWKIDLRPASKASLKPKLFNEEQFTPNLK
ncbi:MAG: OstA-like protein [Flavobacteriales bacterium]